MYKLFINNFFIKEMKATTVLVLLFVIFAAAQANNFIVESTQVQGFFEDFWASVVAKYQEIYNTIYVKVYEIQTNIGMEVVCRTAYAMQFSKYDQTTMVDMCKAAATEQRNMYK